MSKRQATPNVLTDLLDSKTAKGQAREDDSQQADEYPKTKVTHYITDETAERLHMAHFAMRRIARGSTYTRLTKSEMAEAMFKMVLDDLDANGENSALLNYLELKTK